ncbi:hypothetical protein LZZ85_16810 [Terrimonas sp. NA20]|uniref:Uncharacterized protein n=1 Tax=Terrimonas ginsenosidimutans TaxID=2908004 RepID=A0ABS9KUI2_9BACT|nr:hypothetical protein [Terrimonas ginsenosidimutans]MCG2615960.1 hypothetical protein [Terrimonas ginsenosidimutans]
MRNTFFLLIPFCSIIASCDAQSPKNKKMQASATTSQNKTVKQSPYELHGILDPGINGMVAFALQTPTSWKMEQSFTRAWNGSSPINQVYIKLTSPDLGSTIEFLPGSPYYYADGPTTRSLRETSRAYGMPQQYNQYEMPPMSPVEYIKRLFLPYLSQKGLQVRMTAEKTLPSKQTSATMQTYTAYIDGESNGRKVRIDCMINMTTTNMNGEVYYNWEAYPTLILTNGDTDPLYKHIAHARNALLSNPAWVQKNTQLVRNGFIANDEINRRNRDMVKNYRDHVQKTGEDIANERNLSSDKRHESFRDVIGGQAKYADPETGDRVKLADKYNHVYKDKQGNYHGTNDAVNDAQFDWVELQRLETKNYK